MKKNLAVVFLALVATLCLAFGLSACAPAPDSTSDNNSNDNNNSSQTPPDDEPQTAESLDYELNLDGQTYTCTGLGTVTKSAITIESQINGRPVTAIGRHAFGFCENITSVTIPSSVLSIGSRAFNGCTGLTSIAIPANVASIGDSAFEGCINLASATIANGVTTIGVEAFYNCIALAEISIPDSVTVIGNWAFNGCTSLATVTTGNGLTTVGANAFDGCSSLTAITLPESVTSIGNYAFRETSITDITIPASVSTVGDAAFYHCTGLINVNIPDRAESVSTAFGIAVFEECENLTSVKVGKGVTSFNERSFKTCNKLVNVYITDLAAWFNIDFAEGPANPLFHNNNYKKDGNLYLNDVLIENLNNIPSAVTAIKSFALIGCTSIKHITIPASVTSIGYRTFRFTDQLESVTFENKTGWIASKSVDMSNPTTVTIDDEPTENVTLVKKTYLDYYWKYEAAV